MATGAPGTNGVWLYGEDDSEATFSALLNKAASTTDTQIGLDRARLAVLEQTGRVVQMVSFSTTTAVSTSSSSYIDTGLSVSITPKYASSKLVILITQGISQDTNGGAANVAIFRNTTSIGIMCAVFGFNMPAYYRGMQAATIVETAGSTSARTYKTQISKGTGAGNVYAQYDGTTATITVLEVTA